jgi:hypothetical protein
MIERWKPKAHYELIASWYESVGKVAPDKHRLPEIGFIVDNRVAGWVERTDGMTAIVREVVFNPTTLPSTHEQSLKVLLGVLLDSVVMLGYSEIICLTKEPLLTSVVKKHTFSLTDQSVYILRESDEDDLPEWVDD